MNRKLIALAALALAGALLFPSAAAPGSTDRVHDDVVLSPSSGPNGDYALLNGDDELELDFGPGNPDVEGEGVNAETVTPFDRVFTVTYTGEEVARVYFTDGTDDVTFYEGADHTANVEGNENAIVLGPDETVAVGVLIDARDGSTVESVDEFTVHAEVGTPTATGGEDAEVADFAFDSDAGATETPGTEISTDTPTPDPETPEPTTTSESDGSGGEGGEGGATGGSVTTTTTTAAVTTGAPAGDVGADGDAVPAEFGGLGPMALGGLVGAMLLLLLLLAAFRRLREEE